MTKSIKKAFVTTMVMATTFTAKAQVVINEIMQSNIDCIMDDLNDFPDSWVELYNAGNESVNLSAYSLGTKEDGSDAWQLPAVSLPAKGYRLVYCDKATEDWEAYEPQSKRDANNWHTPYRLESGKDCTLYLFKNGGVVDNLPAGMKKQPAPNIAYGRQNDGGDKWGYQASPTPGSKNCGTIYTNKDILGAPVFSVAGKVFNSGSFSVELSLPEGTAEGTVIRYTTDGSEPTASSTVYSSPITINSTKIVRAKLFCNGKLSPRSTVQSYIKVDRDINLPVFSIVTDNRYLNDNSIGIYVDGTYSYDGSDESKNFFYNWRRPMNFEFFEGVGAESAINQLGEARITGAYTRREPLKSLCLYANKRFGEKRLKYEFFPDQRPGITDFKSIILRNSGNDFNGLYMRDAIIQCSMAKYLDLDWQAWQPAVVFINGEYRGMLNIRERSNEDNIYTNYNGLEDIDMIENWNELKEGTADNWNSFQAFYNERGHSYAEYDKIMDVQEFMNIMIFNAYFYNTDFPGNNIVFWRPRTADGRWRIVVKDTDFGLGLYDSNKYRYNYYEWLYRADESANSSNATRLFRRLMDDADFKREFIDRTAIYMGDFMNFDRVWETWEPMSNKIKDEIVYHREKYSPWANYNNELNNAKSWLMKRTEMVYDHLNDQFNVGQPVALKISKADNKDGDQPIFFNGVQLSRGTFDGKFFVGRQITLKAEGVEAWEIKTKTQDGDYKKTVSGETLSYTITSDCESVEIYAKYDASTVVPEDVWQWVNIIKDGNAYKDLDPSIEHDDYSKNYTTCAWGKERQSAPHPADIEEIDGDRVFVVHAADCINPSDGASAWDNQFWIQAPQEFHEGDVFKLSFRYKASKNARVATQVHKQKPGDYLHWEGIGTLQFTTEWQTFEQTITVGALQSGMWSIAFNLTEEIKTATDFYFDDLSLKINKLVPDVSDSNKLYMNSQSAKKGTTVKIPVYMKNEVPITSFNCDIELPAGLSIATDNGGKYLFEASNRFSSTHAISSSKSDDAIKLSVSSTKSDELSGNDGVVFYIPVKIADNVEAGKQLNVTLLNVKMKDAETLNVINSTMAVGKLTITNTDGIETITTGGADAPRYNLQGVRVDGRYKGIVIQNGKKIVVR